MTDLKTDSQSTRTTQGQPSAKKRRASRLANEPLPLSEETTELAESVSSKEAPNKEAPKRKRQQTAAQATTKTRRQATTKAKQTISTQVKPIWEVSRSTIAARFAHLEQELQQISQQSAAIVEEMEALRAIAHDVEAHETKGSPEVDLPRYAAKPSVSAPPCSTAASHSLPTSHPTVTDPIATENLSAQPLASAQDLEGHFQRSEVRPPFTQPSSPLPPRSPASRSFPSRRVRHRTLKSAVLHLWQRLTQLPQPSSLVSTEMRPVVIALDALLWVLASAGLRYGLNVVASSLPLLGLPISVLIFVPALAAIYAALFLPHASSVGIYRLLLITIGLLIGGKLL